MHFIFVWVLVLMMLNNITSCNVESWRFFQQSVKHNQWYRYTVYASLLLTFYSKKIII